MIKSALSLCQQVNGWSLKGILKKCNGIEEARKRLEAGGTIQLQPKAHRDDAAYADEKCICRTLVDGITKCDPEHPSYLTRCKDAEAHQVSCAIPSLI